MARRSESTAGSVNGTKPTAMTKEEKAARQESIAYGANVTEEYRDMGKGETFIIMTSLCLSVFLAALDQTIISTALPVISQHFNSTAGYTWIGAAYVLGNAASVPSWGKISDIFGRKPILLIAAGLFFLGSVISATAVNIAMLIGGRSVQGVGGGGVLVLVNICISDLFSMRNRGAYYGLVGMTWAFASAAGPLIGGAFTEKVSWRWCFYINLPTSGLAMVVLFFFLKVKNPQVPFWEGIKTIDWVGSLLIVGGTLMFLLGLQFGGVTHPWNSATTLCLIIFGLVTLVIFFIYEWKFAKFPVMPMGLFNHRTRAAALVVCFCHGMVFIAGAFFLPVFFQSVLFAQPLLSGVYLLPFCLTLALSSASTGIFIKKTGKYNPPIRVGFFLMTLGFGLFIDLRRNSGWAKIIIYQLIAGIGTGPQFQAPLIALQSVTQGRDIATATATFQFTRNLATSISIVVGGVLFQNEIKNRMSTLVSIAGQQVASSLTKGSPGANIDVLRGLTNAQAVGIRDVFAVSLSRMWILYAVVGTVGFSATWLIGTHVLSKTRNAPTDAKNVPEDVEKGSEADEEPITNAPELPVQAEGNAHVEQP
jgi:EmrB/QacA subfamily drug resistance transporter